VTEFQDGNFIVMEVMGCQVHAIGKAIRPPFADPITLCMNKLLVLCGKKAMSIWLVALRARPIQLFHRLKN